MAELAIVRVGSSPKARTIPTERQERSRDSSYISELPMGLIRETGV